MIRVTIYNEHVHEQLGLKRFPFQTGWAEPTEELRAWCAPEVAAIEAVHHGALHDTLKSLLEEDPDIRVSHIGTVEMEECGLTEEVLRETDVLLWWGHMAHELVPDEVAVRVADHVLKGMGIIFLHSAHMSKPMHLLLGTSCTLRWRNDDTERLWCCNPTHPIARGVPDCIYLEKEEMYGEHFDIPTPDELVFLANFEGGEVFRSGCIWNRGYGRVFFFQPGHETNPSYLHPDIRKIIRNAVHYLYRPEYRLDKLECLHVPHEK